MSGWGRGWVPIKREKKREEWGYTREQRVCTLHTSGRHMSPQLRHLAVLLCPHTAPSLLTLSPSHFIYHLFLCILSLFNTCALHCPCECIRFSLAVCVVGNLWNLLPIHTCQKEILGGHVLRRTPLVRLSTVCLSPALAPRYLSSFTPYI